MMVLKLILSGLTVCLTILGIGIAVISALIVFTTRLSRFGFIKHSFGEKYISDICTRILVGLMGSIASFALMTSPIGIYYDFRLYLFLLGIDLLFLLIGLLYYRIIVCPNRR